MNHTWQMIVNIIKNPDKKQKLLMLFGLTGIFLALLPELVFTPGKEKASEHAPEINAAEYTASAEERLTEMIQKMQGAGKAYVMITLENRGRKIFIQDEKSEKQIHGMEEGTRQSENFEKEYVIADSREGKRPVEEELIQPRVLGAAIVCEGGDDVRVISRITEMTSVLLGIPSSRICVTKMN